MAGLDDNIPARKTPLSQEELPLVKGLQLLTMKPVRAHPMGLQLSPYIYLLRHVAPLVLVASRMQALGMLRPFLSTWQ